MDITIIKDSTATGKATELFLKGIHWKKQKITDGFDLNDIYRDSTGKLDTASAKEAFARMMERQGRWAGMKKTGKISALLCGVTC